MPYVSIQEAARRLDASESTIRRKIKAGELHAIQEETIQGYRWLVEVSDDQVLTADDHLATNGDQVLTSDDQLGTTPQEASKNAPPRGEQVIIDGDQVLTNGEQVATSTELVRELRRLHDQNVQLAGQVGYLQSELQQAREQIRMLTMDKGPEPPAEPLQQAAEQPAARRSWWRRLFADI